MAQLLPEIIFVKTVDRNVFDALLFVGEISNLPKDDSVTFLKESIDSFKKIDSTKDVKVVPCKEAPGGRVVWTPTGSIDGDFDDVRNIKCAVNKCMKKALQIGAKCPLLILPYATRFEKASLVSVLAACESIYTPFQAREHKGNLSFNKVTKLGVINSENSPAVEYAVPLEMARIIARDIHGGDPERMSAPKVVEYVIEQLKDTCIKISVENNAEVFERSYPLLAAVNRCAGKVARHAGQLIKLQYTGEGPIEKTLFLVGKGITYDTGGADLKVGGVMAGMHRDKGGAAAVAGFFKMLSIYKPANLKVFGAMAMVRNSIGSECYVADEVITSRAGVRVRVGNTDAEGRMVMTDVLCEMKELAVKEKNPYLFTFATLTGHVVRCYGPNYTSCLDNGPARAAKVSELLAESGEVMGEPCEVTRLRKEDFEFNLPLAETEDVVQANDKPSTMTNRGHMSPAAFMITASGLDKHGCNSDQPLPYTHMDIAGSAGSFPDNPTGAPILALAKAFVFK